MVEAPRILVAGGTGAREHALGWKLKQDNPTSTIYFAPGENGGTPQIGPSVDIDPFNIDKIVAYSKDNLIDLVVVGPERPIVNGLTNALRAAGVDSFGPSQEASFLEADKAAAVKFMRENGIPYPESEIFTDYELATQYIKRKGAKKIVIKASGLADGKGVILPDSDEEAEETLKAMLIEGKYIYGGVDAGKTVVVQERLEGNEVSVIGLFSDNEIGLLVPAQDYKRAYDGDKGLNTGGMGAYAPSKHLSREQLEEINDLILEPTRRGMKNREIPYRGALYVGLMLTKDGPKVLEYNIRFGDPETQVQMRLLRSNLYSAMRATMSGTLTADHVINSNKAAVGIVLASEGYPGSYEKGKRISGLERLDSGIVVFHAGTRWNGENLETFGGRVITVTARGNSIEDARNAANKAADIIDFPGKQRRGDIAA